MPAGAHPFIWYDLMTTDMAEAEKFYHAVLGWTGQDSGLSDRHYTVLNAGDTSIGGMMPLPPASKLAGAGPSWLGYVAVTDVDGMAARITAAGGQIHRAPEDIPGVGRFAVAADPQGAAFLLFDPKSVASEATGSSMKPGHIGWNELHADDLETAFAFYAGLFGWTKGTAIDMGPMGAYQLFATGGPDVGGMMKRNPALPGPFWLYYFAVDGIDAAVERVQQAGGTIVSGPNEVPGGAWVIQGMDPQGAMFALVSPTR